MQTSEFKTVWLPFSDSFYKVAFHILGDEAEAKDAVQDLYVKLWNLRDRLDDVSKPLSYGILLLRNLCIDRLRKRKRMDTARLDEGEEMVDEAPLPDRAMIGKDTMCKLRELMENLPEKQRMVLRLRIFDELEFDEISRITAMSQTNCRVMLSMARKNLKRMMNYEK